MTMAEVRSSGVRCCAAIFVGVILAVALVFPYAECNRVKYNTVVRMEGLGNCPEHAISPNAFTFSEVVPMGKTLVGRGTFVLNQSYTKFTKAVARIRKCADRNDPHCEVFQNWRFGEESCALITMKGMIWTPLFTFQPTLSCPLKAGTYSMENVTLDMERLKVIRFPETGFWKVSLMVDADSIARIACFYFECSFIKVRM